MAYCSKCGAEIRSGDCFCSVCGETLAGAPYGTAPDLSKMTSEGHDYTQHFAPSDIEDNKYWCIFCYFNILFVVPLLVHPDSYFVKFHANQGLLMFLAGCALSVVAMIPFVGWIVSAVGGVALMVFTVIRIVELFDGKAKTLPFIGGISLIK